MLRRSFQSRAAAVVGRYNAVPSMVETTEKIIDTLRKHQATFRLSQLGLEVLPHDVDTSFPVCVEWMSSDVVSKGFKFPTLPPQKSSLVPDLLFAKEREKQDMKRASTLALKR